MASSLLSGRWGLSLKEGWHLTMAMSVLMNTFLQHIQDEDVILRQRLAIYTCIFKVILKNLNSI